MSFLWFDGYLNEIPMSMINNDLKEENYSGGKRK